MALAAASEEATEAHVAWAHSAVRAPCACLHHHGVATALQHRSAQHLHMVSQHRRRFVSFLTCLSTDCVMQAAEELLQDAAGQVQQKFWRSALAAEAAAVTGIREEYQQTVETVTLQPRPRQLPELPPAKIAGGSKPAFDPAQLPSLLPAKQPEEALQQSQNSLDAARRAWQAVVGRGP